MAIIKKKIRPELFEKVNYVFKFNLDDFGQKKEIEENGLYVIQF